MEGDIQITVSQFKELLDEYLQDAESLEDGQTVSVRQRVEDFQLWLSLYGYFGDAAFDKANGWS